MLCEYDEGRYYDTWTVTDQVTNINDVCTQVHDTHSCDNHCQAYQINMNREVSVFIWHYMGKSVREWELLKIKAAQLAARAQRSVLGHVRAQRSVLGHVRAQRSVHGHVRVQRSVQAKMVKIPDVSPSSCAIETSAVAINTSTVAIDSAISCHR
ncbi:hypothetical protein Hamer_G018487 [Homarus americanus]|uniref:Uncharacterized protein n=1 Tax=Homarus americanus TaxID=6706 RepID=A0A8J5MSD7_HOMAM|nr:hypothetical protein Hamer_G007554 [Homarus americanus]KAG7168044.1 hypothetical protein Hamer_G018487 [Homarus americanus]